MAAQSKASCSDLPTLPPVPQTGGSAPRGLAFGWNISSLRKEVTVWDGAGLGWRVRPTLRSTWVCGDSDWAPRGRGLLLNLIMVAFVCGTLREKEICGGPEGLVLKCKHGGSESDFRQGGILSLKSSNVVPRFVSAVLTFSWIPGQLVGPGTSPRSTGAWPWYCLASLCAWGGTVAGRPGRFSRQNCV